MHAQGIAQLAGFRPKQPGAFIDWKFSASAVLESILQTLPRRDRGTGLCDVERKQAEQDHQLCNQTIKKPALEGGRGRPEDEHSALSAAWFLLENHFASPSL
jgi:hypothetical protein